MPNLSHLPILFSCFDFVLQGEPGSDGAAGKDVSNVRAWRLSPLKYNGERRMWRCVYSILLMDISLFWQGAAGLPGDSGQPGQKVRANSGRPQCIVWVCVVKPRINHLLDDHLNSAACTFFFPPLFLLSSGRARCWTRLLPPFLPAQHPHLTQSSVH